MRETLRQKQSRFARYTALLIQFAEARGFEVSYGETYRSPEEAKRRGFSRSLHTSRLAVDLNLFKDGKYQRSTEAHRPLGEFWKSLASDCRWGGDFSSPDGNHYSIEHRGVK